MRRTLYKLAFVVILAVAAFLTAPPTVSAQIHWCDQCDQTGDCIPCCRGHGGGGGCIILCEGW